MQIAWPEVFSHFMSEPTSETIQNLENWEYLEATPELKPLFERSADGEKLMNDISNNSLNTDENSMVDSIINDINGDNKQHQVPSQHQMPQISEEERKMLIQQQQQES